MHWPECTDHMTHSCRVFSKPHSAQAEPGHLQQQQLTALTDSALYQGPVGRQQFLSLDVDVVK